jgi:hypothetical protein
VHRPSLAWLALLVLTLSCSRRKQTIGLQEKTAHLQGVIEQMIPRRFEKPVAAAFQSESKFRRYQQRLRSTPGFEALVEGLGEMLAAVGLVPEDSEIDHLLVTIETADSGGYYDWESKALVAVKPLKDTELDRFCLHELVHVLQDQRFDLRKFVAPEVGLANFDAFIARRFVTEGEARYVEGLYELATLGRRSLSEVSVIGEDYFREVAGMAYQNAGKPGPAREADGRRAMGRLFRLPDYAGPLAIHTMRAWRGWYAVDSLYHRPPRSTEQMLHPEKLSTRATEEPLAIALPNLAATLGPGWKPVFENTAGEAFLQVLLSEQLPEADYRAAVAAAAGWGGDRFRIYRRTGNKRPLLIWRFQWDTERDAYQFEAAYVRASASRNAGRSWPAAVVRRLGAAVAVVEGADDPLGGVLAGALLAEGPTFEGI